MEHSGGTIMKKIIVFGATGNIGAYFVQYAKNYFQNDNIQIIASGKRDSAKVFSSMGVEYVSVDITKPLDFERLPKDNIWAVVHLASALPAYMEGYQPKQYLDSIILGSYNVLEFCRCNNAEKILYSTTCFDVGAYPPGTIIKPDMRKKFNYVGDHAVYIISKNTVCELLEHYHQQYGLKTFIFRLPSVYSYSTNHYVYVDGKKTLRPLYKLIQNAMDGKPLELWGDPNSEKEMLYVYDLAQMFCLAIRNEFLDKGMYNCGTGIPVTLQEQMEAIVEVFCSEGKKSDIVVLPDKEPGYGILMDVENAKSELGYVPQYDVLKLFKDFKKEMQYERFLSLRGK